MDGGVLPLRMVVVFRHLARRFRHFESRLSSGRLKVKYLSEASTLNDAAEDAGGLNSAR